MGSKCFTVSLGFREIFEGKLFSDVSIHFGDGEVIQTHQILLASISDFMKKCLLSTTAEDVAIILPDFSSLDFRQIIPYLYGFSSEGDSELKKLALLDTLRLGHCSSKVQSTQRKVAAAIKTAAPHLTDIDSSLEDFWPEIEAAEEEYVHKCVNCSQAFETQSKLSSHISSNANKCAVNNVTCSECPKSFDSSIKLLRHKIVHKKSAMRKYRCERCSKQFLSSRVLLSHETKVHGIHPKREFQCLNCPKSFNFQSQLRVHSCKKKVELFCDLCETICPNRSALNYHLQKHENPTHQCPQCPKVFQSEYGLEYHLKLHNNETNYVCEFCEKAFVTPYKLIQHTRSKHTQEKPFICEQCGEGFVRNDKLTVHKRRAHTGERPYPCDICDWRGVDSSSLIHHRKKHAKVEAAKNPDATASL